MNYNIFLKNSNNIKKEFPVYMRISENRKSKYISLKISVKKNDWHKSKKIVNRTDLLHLKKNAIIKAYQQKADSILLSNIIDNKQLSLDAFILKLANKNLTAFFDFANKIILEKEKRVAKNTHAGYVMSCKKLKGFKSDFDIIDVDENFLNQYRDYMHGENLEPSTQSIYVAFISMILNAAVKAQLINYNPASSFSIKYVKNQKPFLNTNEIALLEKLEKSKKLKSRYKATLKLFLFSCYTGISFIDLTQLTKENVQTVKVDNKKYSMIYDNRQKTKNSFRVPLTEKAMRIINESKTFNKKLFHVHKAPTIAYQIGQIREASPEIKKHFTFHTARHSFGTYWASQGVSEKILMEMMGHTESKTNRIYSKIQDFTLINTILK